MRAAILLLLATSACVFPAGGGNRYRCVGPADCIAFPGTECRAGYCDPPPGASGSSSGASGSGAGGSSGASGSGAGGSSGTTASSGRQYMFDEADAFAPLFVAAVCEWTARCAGGQPWRYPDTATCRDVQLLDGGTFPGAGAYFAYRYTIHPEHFASCASAIAQLPCDFGYPPEFLDAPGCEDAFDIPDPIPLGGQCAGDLDTRFRCARGLRCDPTTGTCGHYFTDTTGEPCESPYECSSGACETQMCAPPPGLGEPCGAQGGLCEFWLECRGDEPRTCQAYAQPGERCGAQASCGATGDCTFGPDGGFCRTKGADGEACTPDFLSVSCQHVCNFARAGDATGICGWPQGTTNGSPCFYSVVWQCDPGFYRSFDEGSATPSCTCLVVKPAGAACTDNEQCQSRACDGGCLD